MKERADSAEDNYFGDIFVQLRHHLLMHHPEMLTEDDLKFTSPVKGRGKTEEELEGSFNEQLWQVNQLTREKSIFFQKLFKLIFFVYL